MHRPIGLKLALVALKVALRYMNKCPVCAFVNWQVLQDTVE